MEKLPAWDETHDLPRFEDTKDTPSQLESALRGAAQGASFNFADELTGALEAGKEALVGSDQLSDLPENYQKYRNESRAAYKAAEAANPKTFVGGQLAGGLASLLVPAAGTTRAAKFATSIGQGALAGIGSGETAEEMAAGAGIGALAGGVGQAAGEQLGKVAPKVRDYLAKKLGKVAEKVAITATGATGAQAQKFAKGTGEYLTKNNLIGALDNPEAVAQTVQNKMTGALSNIDDALVASGQSINEADVLNAMKARQAQLATSAPTLPLSREMRPFIEDYASTMGPEGTTVSAKALEDLKRAYHEQISNFYNPLSEGGKKEVTGAIRESVESAMSKVPEQSATFLENKKTYGMLSPVLDAARARAAQQSQSPWGSFLDAETMQAAGGGIQAIPAAITRRLVAPRAAAMTHVATRSLSRALQNPNLSKYSGVIQNAIQRGPDAAATTHFLLQNMSEEYRNMLRDEK